MASKAENSSLPFEFESVILCDDIRQERNGKHILIGVYGANILVPSFPANLTLSVWLHAVPTTVGKHKLEFRVMGPNEAQLAIGKLEVQISDPSVPIIMALPNLRLQLQQPGQVRLQMVRDGQNNWFDFKSLPIALAPAKSGPAPNIEQTH